MNENFYDVIIIGAGPAGLSAALYASRSMLNTLVIEKAVIGGLITTTTEIENYPGSEENATGESITKRMHAQCFKSGTHFESNEIISIKKENELFHLANADGKEYTAKCLVMATGTYPRLLGAKGEIEFRGRGVSYCATCDAGFFKNLHVAVVGGGDTAIKEAEYLTKFASKVTVIHRRREFRAMNATIQKIKENDKIHFLYDSTVDEIKGDFVVRALAINDLQTNSKYDYPVDGIFIFAGYEPNSKLVENLAKLDEKGYIITNEKMQTSLSGLYAVGDVRNTVLRQVITAAADGAICGVEVEKYLADMK